MGAEKLKIEPQKPKKSPEQEQKEKENANLHRLENTVYLNLLALKRDIDKKKKGEKVDDRAVFEKMENVNYSLGNFNLEINRLECDGEPWHGKFDGAIESFATYLENNENLLPKYRYSPDHFRSLKYKK